MESQVPKVIKDEFSGKKMSRQRRYQLRKRKEGKCILCGDPTLASIGKKPFSTKHCAKHNEAHLAGERGRYKRKVS